jgi:hypothetical protein
MKKNFLPAATFVVAAMIALPAAAQDAGTASA